MGTELPPDWPEIDDDLWYHVTVEVFGGMNADGSCRIPGGVYWDCCVKGIAIRTYINSDTQCQKPFAFCVPNPFQKLHNVGSSYPTQIACQLANP